MNELFSPAALASQVFVAVYLVYFVVFIAIFADWISTHEISRDILRPETFNLSIENLRDWEG